jgi:hypothetical protein
MPPVRRGRRSSPFNLEDPVAGKGLPLAVKYVPVSCAGMYQAPNDGLFIGRVISPGAGACR